MEWIDAARGLGIVLVVLGHVQSGVAAAGVSGWSGWPILEYTLYTFHMPLFFFLAGINARGGIERGAQAYLRPKLLTIVYPYVLWSLIQGLVIISAGGATNGSASYGDLLQIGWRPMSQFWFLWALMACQIVVAVTGYRPRLLWAIAAVSLGLSEIKGFEGILEQTSFSLPFFILGLQGAGRATALGQARDARWIVPLGLLFAVCVYLAWRASRSDWNTFWTAPAALAGIATTIAAARALKGRALKVAVYLGSASMTIYVMHILVASTLRVILLKLGAPQVDWLLVALCTTAGVIGPLAAHALLARMDLLPLLGLGARKSTPKPLAISPGLA